MLAFLTAAFLYFLLWLHFAMVCQSGLSSLFIQTIQLKKSVVDSMVANFASSVRQVLASKTQPNQVMADITESLVCVIGRSLSQNYKKPKKF